MKTTRETSFHDIAYYKRGNVDLSVTSAHQGGTSRYHIYVNGYINDELPKVKGFRRSNRLGYYSVDTRDREEAVETLLDALDGTDLYVNFRAETKDK